jgi:hypothetical protein
MRPTKQNIRSRARTGRRITVTLDRIFTMARVPTVA